MIDLFDLETTQMKIINEQKGKGRRIKICDKIIDTHLVKWFYSNIVFKDEEFYSNSILPPKTVLILFYIYSICICNSCVMDLVLWIIFLLTIAGDHFSTFVLNQIKSLEVSSLKHTADQTISSCVSWFLIFGLWLYQCCSTEILPIMIKKHGEGVFYLQIRYLYV